MPIRRVVGYSCNSRVTTEPVYPTGWWSQPGDRDDHLSPLAACRESSSTTNASYSVEMKLLQLTGHQRNFSVFCILWATSLGAFFSGSIIILLFLTAE